MLRFLTTLTLLLTTSLVNATEVPLTFSPHRDLTFRPQPDTVLDVTLRSARERNDETLEHIYFGGSFKNETVRQDRLHGFHTRLAKYRSS
jgi:hypothetical protein